MANHPDDDKKKAFSSFADNLLDVEKQDKEAKKRIIKEGVERIESEAKKSLKSSKLLTSELASLREKADMSPFVGTSGKITSPRLRRGEFIEILGRELLWIGREELKDKGGIISLSHLRAYFSETRDNWELRDKDIVEALEWLDQEEMIPNLDKLSDEQALVHFRPVELSTDMRHILNAAMGIEVTKSRLETVLGWSSERIDAGLKQLEQDGIAIVEGENIYFPGL